MNFFRDEKGTLEVLGEEWMEDPNMYIWKLPLAAKMAFGIFTLK